jgi:hypothetical protein
MRNELKLQHVPLNSTHVPLHVMAGLVPANHNYRSREHPTSDDKREADGRGVDSIRTKRALAISPMQERRIP